MRIFGYNIAYQIPGIDDLTPINVGNVFPVQENERDIRGWAFTAEYSGDLTQHLTKKLTLYKKHLGEKSCNIILHSLLRNGNTKVIYYYSRRNAIDPTDAYHRASMANSVLFCAARENKKRVA